MKKFGDYYVTIGLEIHVALATSKKLFSTTPNTFQSDTLTWFDIGVPGVLPVLEREPVEMAVAFGLATQSDIRHVSYFERKHYFYPDLPLGYQITQQEDPILWGGSVPIRLDGVDKTIAIEHSHLECDAAKSVHDASDDYTLIDVSRVASPLLEIVSRPCMHSPEEAVEYAKAVHRLVVALGICDGKLQEGSFRVDASISLSKDPSRLGTRVECKNISSFSFLKAALMHEITRQSDILDDGSSVVMETRLFDETHGVTRSMRSKETVAEYRYMRDPDIPALVIDETFISDVQQRYATDFFDFREHLIAHVSQRGLILSEGQIELLCAYPRDVLLGGFTSTDVYWKTLAYWLPDLKARFPEARSLTLEQLQTLGSMDASASKTMLTTYISSETPWNECQPMTSLDPQWVAVIHEVLQTHPEQCDKMRHGDEKMKHFLMGQCMKRLKKHATPALILPYLV